MSQFPKLNGQFGQFSGTLGSFNLLSKLRRTYMVVVGADAPQPEKDNADAIASYMMQKLNFSRAVLSDDARLEQTSKFANIITIGGPAANEWAFKLNDFLNPRYDITVLKDRVADQTWKDYVLGGGIRVNGFILNDQKLASGSHTGLIGKGQNSSYPRLRPLQVAHIGGWEFEDTCCMTKAFLEDQEAGIYTTIWAVADPTMTKCPADGNYKISKPVA